VTTPTLSRSTLASLPARVGGLRYDPRRITAGIVHLGPGAFHRAHMARYVHALMQDDDAALEWGIIGAGMTPADEAVRKALDPQDCLYTLVEGDDQGASAQVIGAIIEILGPDEVEAVLARIDEPGVRIVSLTISEGGYCLQAENRRLDLGHPAIRADLADPRRPRSAIGVLVEAYRRRWVSGRPAFTGLSCDNLPGNGRLLEGAVIDFARQIDGNLATWIAKHARFPSSMVDRITPVTRPDDVAAFRARYGLVDAWSIFCEPFTQWVIEDRFADGRPPWEGVGVLFTDDVGPFEQMKLRLLNTSHLALASLGFLLGHQLVAEAMRDPRLERFVRSLMSEETAPTLTAPPMVDLADYQDQVIARFANRTLRDTIERINTDASLNLLLDPIRDRLAAGLSIERLCLAVAAWIRRLQLLPLDQLAVRHPLAEELRAAARVGGDDPTEVFSVGDVFGDVWFSPEFVTLVAKGLKALREDPGLAI